MKLECKACGFETDKNHTECPRCGLIFSKYRAGRVEKDLAYEKDRHSNIKTPVASKESVEDDDSFFEKLFFYVKPHADLPDFVFRLAFAVIFVLWGLALIFYAKKGDGGGIGFWHLVNLPFHEAGHVIFRPFGQFIMTLGGTLGQLGMPLICMAVFLLKTRDTFAAGFSLWWLGVNFIDIAPYIGDARSLSLPLIGGNFGFSSPYGFHDWEYILTETGLLSWDKTLSGFSFLLGSILIITACLWWGIVLLKYKAHVSD